MEMEIIILNRHGQRGTVWRGCGQNSYIRNIIIYYTIDISKYVIDKMINDDCILYIRTLWIITSQIGQYDFVWYLFYIKCYE